MALSNLAPWMYKLAFGAHPTSSASQPTASARAMDTDLRIANDGRAYNRADFQEHYGCDAWRMWKKAHKPHNQSAASSSCASQPTVKDEHRPQEDNTRATSASHDWPNTRAAQPATLRNDGDEERQDGCAPQPTVKEEHESLECHQVLVNTDTMSTDTVQLTFAQLESRPIVHGAGGKMAWQKQKELRATLMQEGVYEHNLTHEPWPWRDVLRALPRPMQAILTGPGITKFSFRLLRGQLDHNYRNRDSGERHVFEIQHADGTQYHLHYHKNGSMDYPKLVSPAGPPAQIGGATQPAHGSVQRTKIHQEMDVTYNVAACLVVATADMLTPSPPSPAVGRREAHTACTTLCVLCAGMDKCAIDITDELAFPWRRWIINIAEARQTLAVNVVLVFMIRWERDQPPCITMCRKDSTYVCIWPQTQQYGDAVTEMEVHADWPSLQILRTPWYVTTDWLSARAS